jgi:hypothetical protein
MTHDAKSGPRCGRPRIATLSLCVGFIVIVCSLPAANSIASVEPLVARDCAQWADEEFDSPSPARDEAFIDCIVQRDPSATTVEMRHKLETGDGSELFDRLMTGENLPIAPESDCPYLRVAVESPFVSDDSTQMPMRELFSTALMRAGFHVVNANADHHWWASSLALDTGANSAAWTILVRAVPEIGGGGIQFTSIQKSVSGREGSFSGFQSLRTFSKDEAPEIARLAAEGVARELLPAAHRRCEDLDAALEEERLRLEQLRTVLAEEIERVRREKAQREEARRQKQLEIEVEGYPGGTDRPQTGS